jgi:hypothetical protein
MGKKHVWFVKAGCNTAVKDRCPARDDAKTLHLAPNRDAAVDWVNEQHRESVAQGGAGYRYHS